MYPSKKLHHWPMALAALSGQALAVGFGDITLTSRIGEPLHAEVAIVSSPHDTVDTACFSLAPLRESDLPVITSARLKLVKDSLSYRLIISGTAPIADPAFVLALRAGCGVELQRDFILIPAAPTISAEAPAAPWVTAHPSAAATAVDGTVAQSALTQDRPASRGDTQKSIAAVSQPNKASSAPVPRAAPKPKAAAPLVKQAVSGNNRLTLGPPPADFKPGERAPQSQDSSPRGSTPPEMEERMQRMEKTISLLNDQINKLDQALALTSEVLAAQQKLQANSMAQGAVREASFSLPAPLPAPPSTTGNWVELLLSALSGGIIASLALHSLAARRKNAVDSEFPLAMLAPGNSNRTESPSPMTAALPVESAGSKWSITTPSHGRAPETAEKSQLVVEQAEIMLSVGRVYEAADTLAEHIDKDRPSQPAPWLMLLDLYRRSNRPREFEVLASQIHRKFNIHVAAWDEEEAQAIDPDALERHPHIVERVTQTWGQQKCLDYLRTLLKDNRSGQRRGFSRQAAEEISLLARVLENGYGLRAS